MGKNKRRQLEFYDSIHDETLSVDSSEEIDTLEWLIEAKDNGIINDFKYQPESFKLFDSEKYVTIDNKQRTLFRDHIYSADFVISFDPNKQKELATEFKVSYDQLSSNDLSIYVDTKGTFNKTERAFGINQKWVYQKFKIFIYKLVPKNFFKLFGCPTKCFLTTKKKQPRKMFQGYSSIKQCFNIK